MSRGWGISLILKMVQSLLDYENRLAREWANLISCWGEEQAFTLICPQTRCEEQIERKQITGEELEFTYHVKISKAKCRTLSKSKTNISPCSTEWGTWSFLSFRIILRFRIQKCITFSPKILSFVRVINTPDEDLQGKFGIVSLRYHFMLFFLSFTILNFRSSHITPMGFTKSAFLSAVKNISNPQVEM